MNTHRVTPVRRALLVLCALALIWAVVVSLTGGFVVRAYSIRVSSQTPQNPLVLAVLSGLVAWMLSGPDRRRTMREDWLWCRSVGSAGLRALHHRWSQLRRVDPSIVIAVVGIGLTLHHWSLARSLWLDEEMMALNVRDRSFVELAGPLWLGQSAPFGWLVLERATVLTLGTSERALRLVPMLFGVATFAAVIWIGRHWMGRVGASLLILLCSFGQWLSYYYVELKHYSADAFGALLLPALAAWALETKPGESTRQRRLVIWWTTAAAGHWFANGALLVTPACALVVIVTSWRRSGLRGALAAASLGCVWLATFAAHYYLAVRHTLDNPYLQGYWSFALPPASAGFTGTLSWLVAQFQPLADIPGGTGLWLLFWISAACGLALSSSPTLGVLLAAVPISAFALAALRLVPLYQRLSLWIVPALYTGIALLSDRVVSSGREGYGRRRWSRQAATVLVAFAGFQLCFDIVQRGVNDIREGRPPDSHHLLDDRTAVRWLMQHAQPGDVLMTTRLALPAVWWYGGITISDADHGGGRQPDGSPILVVAQVPPGHRCRRSELRDVLNGRRRALVYLGFRFDVSKQFDNLLLEGLRELGTITASRDFADSSRAAVVELRSPTPGEPVLAANRHDAPGEGSGVPAGCLEVHEAFRW